VVQTDGWILLVFSLGGAFPLLSRRLFGEVLGFVFVHPFQTSHVLFPTTHRKYEAMQPSSHEGRVGDCLSASPGTPIVRLLRDGRRWEGVFGPLLQSTF